MVKYESVCHRNLCLYVGKIGVSPTLALLTTEQTFGGKLKW